MADSKQKSATVTTAAVPSLFCACAQVSQSLEIVNKILNNTDHCRVPFFIVCMRAQVSPSLEIINGNPQYWPLPRSFLYCLLARAGEPQPGDGCGAELELPKSRHQLRHRRQVCPRRRSLPQVIIRILGLLLLSCFLKGVGH
jgi:hypothetical protein